MGDARLVRAGFCGDDVHLLLHEHFEGLVCGAALDGIRDGERAEVARVGEVAPLVRFGEAEARELVAVVGDAKCAERRAEPAALLVVVRLAAEDGRDGFFHAENLRVRGDVAAVHEQAEGGHLDEIERATAEKYVNLCADIRREKCAPRGLALRVRRGRIRGDRARVEAAFLCVVVPFFSERAFPVRLECRAVCAVQIQRALARAAGREPFHDDGAARLRAVPFAECLAEFRADGLVVRRDDGERVLALEHRLVAARTHEDGAEHDCEQHGEQGEIFAHATRGARSRRQDRRWQRARCDHCRMRSVG